MTTFPVVTNTVVACDNVRSSDQLPIACNNVPSSEQPLIACNKGPSNDQQLSGIPYNNVPSSDQLLALPVTAFLEVINYWHCF